jgi:hypothetical protein
VWSEIYRIWSRKIITRQGIAERNFDMNQFRYGALVIFAALAASSLQAQDALATIKAAEYALGMIRGPQRIDAINTMEVWATGTAVLGSGAATQVNYHASYSYRTPAMRIDISRADAAHPARQIEVFNNEFSWNESVPGAGFIPGSTATPVPAALAERQLEMWTTPHGILKAAERAAKEAKIAKDGGATALTFPLGGSLAGITARITFNAKNEVDKIQTMGTSATLRDANTETTYSGYKDLGEIATDVMFPARMVRKRGGTVVLDLTVSKVDANNPYVVFPVPDVVEKAPKGAR